MKRLLAALVLLLITTTVASSNVVVIFVDDSSQAGEPQGTSWADAYSSLDDAIASVPEHPNIEYQFWVAEGVYTPDTSEGWSITPNMTFYGGFLGSELGPQNRLGSRDNTIFSGDLNENTQTDPGDATHLFSQRWAFIVSPSHEPIVFDGFTFERTYASATGEPSSETSGGAIYLSGEENPATSMVINDCVFQHNYAKHYGGAIYSNYAIKLQITRTQFLNNCSESAGGAIYIEMSGATFPLTEYGFLPGIYETIISHCVFTHNTSAFGAALCSNSISADSVFLISNCLLRENRSVSDCGTVYFGSRQATNFDPGTYRIYHSTIADNMGGGVYVAGDGLDHPVFGLALKDIEIRSSIIRFNASSEQAENLKIEFGLSTSMWVQYNNLIDEHGQAWAGTGNISDDPMFVDRGQDVYALRGNSPCINAADDKTVLIDAADLDGDNNYFDRIQIDLDGSPREERYAGRITGLNTLGSDPDAVSDMGCYEASINQLFYHRR